jgi:hypothetical protein
MKFIGQCPIARSVSTSKKIAMRLNYASENGMLNQKTWRPRGYAKSNVFEGFRLMKTWNLLGIGQMAYTGQSL